MSKGSTHAEFRSLWEEKLEEVVRHQVIVLSDSTSEEKLHRYYHSKVTNELRHTVMGKLWILDGKDSPPRKTRTWEEVAEAIDRELSIRADARAPQDAINQLSDSGALALGRPTQICKHCNRSGHPAEICPKMCAMRRGDVDKRLADFEKSDWVRILRSPRASGRSSPLGRERCQLHCRSGR